LNNILPDPKAPTSTAHHNSHLNYLQRQLDNYLQETVPGDGKFTRRREEKERANQASQRNDQWQDYPPRAGGTAGIIPTNLASWVTSVLQHGEKGTKLVQCMESKIFLDQNDGDVQNGLLRFICNSNAGTNGSWLSLSGRHEECGPDGELRPLAEDMKQVFWWKDVLFVVDGRSQETKPDNQYDDNQQDWNPPSRKNRSLEHKMTIRCFGHSNGPIIALLEHIKMETKQSEQLQVQKKGAETESYETRDKRPLSSIDMEPDMHRQVLQDVNDFFHPDSKRLYKDTSRPYRHGFLLHGPPGTGKTSLSVAIAPNVSVTLVIINMQDMDDDDLERAFSSVPLPCVILLEDIDACSVDVSRRGPSKRMELDQEDQPIDEVQTIGMIEHTLSGFDKQTKQLHKSQEEFFRFMKDHVAQPGAFQMAHSN
jgi:hypothetical protein